MICYSFVVVSIKSSY